MIILAITNMYQPFQLMQEIIIGVMMYNKLVLRPSGVSNDNLKWETSEQANIGC